MGAIVGAILGFSISEFRQWKTEGQQINALRKMLKLEINQNLVLLTEFQNKANADIADIFEFVIKNSFTLWNYTVWQSQQMLLPIALLDEEINQIYILNKEFDLIIKKYNLVNKLVLKLSEIGVIKYSGAIEMGEAFGKMEVRDNLVKEVEKEWEELNKMITEIINNYVVKNFIGL